MELLDDKMRIWIDSAKFVKPMPGVYVLYNRRKEPIYIGATDNLEATFTKYVDDDFDGDECKQKTQTYQREFTESPQERKMQLIEQIKNESGKIPNCNSEIKIET